MNKTYTMFKPGLMLLAVAAVAALILGFVNWGTAGRIAAIAEDTMNSAMQAVLPAASYTDAGFEANGEIEAIYAADTGGWVVEVTESGSQGLITMMVGVSSDYVCTGISITESSETAGLGAIAGQQSEKGEAFRAQFVGQSGTVAVTKEGGSIDAISGATITSKAVCRGVTAAIDACRSLSPAPAAAAEAGVESAAPASAETGASASAETEAQASSESSAEVGTEPSAEPAGSASQQPSGEPSQG